MLGWFLAGWCVGKGQTPNGRPAVGPLFLGGLSWAGKVWKAGGGVLSPRAAFQGPAGVGCSHVAQSKGEGVRALQLEASPCPPRVLLWQRQVWARLLQSWSCECLEVSVAEGPLEPEAAAQGLPGFQRGCATSGRGLPLRISLLPNGHERPQQGPMSPLSPAPQNSLRPGDALQALACLAWSLVLFLPFICLGWEKSPL